MSRERVGDIASARLVGAVRKSNRTGTRGFGLGVLAYWCRRSRRSADRGCGAAVGALVPDGRMPRTRRAGTFRSRREPRRTSQYAIVCGAWCGTLSAEGLVPRDGGALDKRL